MTACVVGECLASEETMAIEDLQEMTSDPPTSWTAEGQWDLGHQL